MACCGAGCETGEAHWDGRTVGTTQMDPLDMNDTMQNMICGHGPAERCANHRQRRLWPWLMWFGCVMTVAGTDESAWAQPPRPLPAAGEADPTADDLVADLEERAFKEAAALVSPSLVRIETVGGLDRVGETLTVTGATTGVIVSADGLILTSSFNFVSKPSSIVVTLPDGRKVPADLVSSDRSRMLTLIKAAADGLQPATAAPSEGIRVGQWSIALGKTYDGPLPSMSVGIVSAVKRIWGKAIQTDAKISPVNYGGPLVDIEGRVMGILVPLSPQAQGETAGVEWYDGGIGFAIPLEDAYRSVERLKAGKDLFPGQMGAGLGSQDLYGTDAVIDRVRFGSPAEKAGLKKGDIIREANGQKVRRASNLMHVLGTLYAGDQLALVVERQGKAEKIELQLVDKIPPFEQAFLGLLPERDAARKDRRPGVGIRYVFPGSGLEQAGVKKGERIVGCEGQAIGDLSALSAILSRTLPGKSLSLEIAGADAKRTVQVELSGTETQIPKDLKSVALLPAEDGAAGAPPEQRKKGRFADRMPAHEREYWAYVPEDYNPQNSYGLLVWVHPKGDTLEAEQFKAWKSLCEERGLILLGPKAKELAGWQNEDAEFIKELVQEFQSKYSIDPSRIAVHGIQGGGSFAYFLAFKYRELFRGVCTIGAPLRTRPPEVEPEKRLQILLMADEKDANLEALTKAADGLQKLKYPARFVSLELGESQYPSGEGLRAILLWLDSLDRW